MNDGLNAWLASHDGQAAFDREMAAMLRAHDHVGAEQRLVPALAARPGAVADACAAATAEKVSIEGWDALWHALAGRPRTTALGLNLSNYNEADEGAAWFDKAPAIEVGHYSDESYGFSRLSIDAIQVGCERAPTPWQGRMDPVEGPPPVRVTGLRRLNGLLLRIDSEPTGRLGAGSPEDEAAAAVLGAWFRHLRFHQAVARVLARNGLPRPLPVILGEHDLGPFVRAAIAGEAGPTPARPPAPSAASPEEEAEAPSSGPAVAEAFIAEMRAARASIKGCRLFDGAKKRDLITRAQTREQAFLAEIGLAWPTPSWESTDTRFEAFAHTVRICCDLPPPDTAPRPSATAEPPAAPKLPAAPEPPAVPEPPTALEPAAPSVVQGLPPRAGPAPRTGGFGRKGLSQTG